MDGLKWIPGPTWPGNPACDRNLAPFDTSEDFLLNCLELLRRQTRNSRVIEIRMRDARNFLLFVNVP